MQDFGNSRHDYPLDAQRGRQLRWILDHREGHLQRPETIPLRFAVMPGEGATTRTKARNQCTLCAPITLVLEPITLIILVFVRLLGVTGIVSHDIQISLVENDTHKIFVHQWR